MSAEWTERRRATMEFWAAAMRARHWEKKITRPLDYIEFKESGYTPSGNV